MNGELRPRLSYTLEHADSPLHVRITYLEVFVDGSCFKIFYDIDLSSSESTVQATNVFF